MINSLSVLAIIPARGGSKGIPRKNIKPVGGVPLIHHTITAAKQSKYIDVVHVSTDDEEIKQSAEACGVHVPFLRDPSYAEDHVPNIPDVVSHTVEQVKDSNICDPDIVLLLEPTYPFRDPHTIDRVVEKISQSDSDWVVTVSKTKEHPLRMRKMNNKTSEIVPFIRSDNTFVQRQDFNDLYNIKGAVYGCKTQNIKKQITECSWEGEVIQPIESIDIDDQFDLKIARALFGDKDEN